MTRAALQLDTGERRAPLRGCERELAFVRDRVDALADGRGSVVAIEGAAGFGKTSFLTAAAGMAEEAGARVMRGGGDATARVIPFGTLLDTLTGGECPVADTAALRVLAGSPDSRFWVLREVQECLERAAVAGPLVIAIDDLQRADEGTVLGVRMLSNRLSPQPILWLLTSRPLGLEAPRTRLGEPPDHKIELARLDDAAVAQVAQDALGAPPDDAVMNAIRDLGGHPLLLWQLLRGASEDGLVRVQDGRAGLASGRLSTRFRATVAEQLADLGRSASRMVRMASVLGRRFSVEQLSLLLERPPRWLLGPLDEALGSGLLVERDGGLTFRHDLIREAVQESLPATMRRSLRRRLVDSHSEVVQRGAPGPALAGRTDELRLHLRLTRTQGCLATGLVADAAAAVLDDVGATRAASDTETEVAALTSCSIVSFHRHRYAHALDYVDEARARAARGGPEAQMTWPNVWGVWLRGTLGPLDEALPRASGGLRAAQREGRSADARFWLTCRSMLLLTAGRLSDARADAHALREMNRDRGLGGLGMTCDYVLGRVALHIGDPAELTEAARAAVELQADTSILLRRAGNRLAALLADGDGDTAHALGLLTETIDALADPAPTLGAPENPLELMRLMRVVIRAGDRGRAAAVVRELVRGAELNPDFPLHVRLARHAFGVLTHDADAIRDSVKGIDTFPGSIARAQTLEDAADVLVARSRSEAIGHLDAALELYASEGADRDAARVRHRLRAIGVRRRRSAAAPQASGWAGLTQSELAVVRVVADGATNRQAADALFLSPHTVSSHLRHTFAKLGISSRVELAKHYAERDRRPMA